MILIHLLYFKSFQGLSALHWAAQSGHCDATKLLIQYNAFPNLMEFNEDRLTPLDYALQNNHEEVAQYLMETGKLMDWPNISNRIFQSIGVLHCILKRIESSNIFFSHQIIEIVR